MSQSAISGHLQGDISVAEVCAQLEKILASSWFKNSKRHTRFLRYIVEKTISGDIQDIKERSIGIEVFDRRPDYDLANDAIVRVAAGDIRKRLAQYYIHEGKSAEIVLELPSGSYAPVFCAPNHSLEVQEVPQEALSISPFLPVSEPISDLKSIPEPVTPSKLPHMGSSSRRRFLAVALSTLLVLAALAGVFAYLLRPSRALGAFWKPMMIADQSALVCIGDLQFVMDPDTTEITAEPVNQVIRHRNHIGQSDLSAMARLTGVLGREGRPSKVILADNANLSDLRTQPAIFIGAFDNPWSQRVLQDSAIRLRRDPITGNGSIVSYQKSKEVNWAVDLNTPLGTVHRDYALIARFESPLTGQTDLVLAGVGPYGTAAASEFVSNPEYFRQFSSQAPRGWERKNIEIVLSTDVVDGRSAPPRMIFFDVR
jgi:hypothetical protein